MVKVCIIQIDNRLTLDYLLLSQQVNKKVCEKFNYNYNFFDMNNKYTNHHSIVKKIYFINDFINTNTEYDVIVFLDSDAWVQNGYNLNTIIDYLMNNDKKIGCYSRDPFLVRNTYINSGAFILKINDESRKMYRDIITLINNNPKFITNYFPFYDQPAISYYIYNNKEKFLIFNIEILNTPIGTVLRHNWHKNKLMFDDLHKTLELLDNNYEILNTKFIIEDNLDTNEFPNKEDLEDYSYLK